MPLHHIEKLVVIAGCQRSGTTLTGQIIGAHPKAFLIDEGDGLYDWFHSTDNDLQEETNKFAEMIKKADVKYNANHSRLEKHGSDNVSLGKHISHLVLKAPNLTYSFSRLADLNIPVTVIYPKRDPRSVVASMMKLAGINMVGNQCRLLRRNESLAAEFLSELSRIEKDQVPDHIKRALIWKIKTEMVQKFIMAGIPTFNFDYEELVSDKKTYCSKFAQHVGLTHHPMMEEPQNIYQGMGPGGTNRTRAIDNRSTLLWKKTLTNQEANDILDVTQYRVKAFA